MKAGRLDELADHVATRIRIAGFEGKGEAMYNQGGDKALIDFTYDTGEDRLIYTATFHRVGGSWRLRGIRETLQQFGLPRGIPVRPWIDLPSPPELITVPAIPLGKTNCIANPLACAK